MKHGSLGMFAGQNAVAALVTISIACFCFPAARLAAEDDKLVKLTQENAEEYRKLGEWCQGQQLPVEARTAFQEALRLDPANQKAKDSLDAKAVERAKDYDKRLAAYEQKLKKMEDDCIGKYTALGKTLAKEKQPDKAKEAFRLALDIDSKSEGVHKAMDEVLLKDIGWVPKNVADQVRKGLREYKGEWKAKDQVEKLRSQWTDAWEIETDHYKVKSNMTWEEVQSLAQMLEDCYCAFSRVFGRAWKLSPPATKMAVNCYKSREEFQDAIKSVDPRAVNAPGLYNGNVKTAFFFRREGYLTTVAHECTHQVLDLVAGQAEGLQETAQFWVVEGIPSCFETMEWTGRKASFGGKDTPKMAFLRKMGTSGVMKLADFSKVKQAEFMSSQEKYSQALGLTHYLLNADGGKYRERFLEFAREVLDGKGNPELFNERFKDDIPGIENGWMTFCAPAK